MRNVIYAETMVYDDELMPQGWSVEQFAVGRLCRRIGYEIGKMNVNVSAKRVGRWPHANATVYKIGLAVLPEEEYKRLKAVEAELKRLTEKVNL